MRDKEGMMEGYIDLRNLVRLLLDSLALVGIMLKPNWLPDTDETPHVRDAFFQGKLLYPAETKKVKALRK